ncbi:methionyl-tRNA formyltransferase [Tepidamorphus sp. 3E244]|uniref:methionyl-tRNA formyltransferase n=1 Tax=Tepidamorphus sp. 3E244 TaxID=3385498 RepID=UPI0038FC5CD2
MGTPDFAVPTLVEIVGQGHEVVAVYSQPPRPAGRGQAERRSPVHEAAAGFGLPVLTPASMKDDIAQAEFASHEADVAVVVAYGQLLPQVVLDAPEHGCLNLHASLLPRWRGAAPIQRAIMAGDAETGVMVMRMEAGLDTGPVAMTEKLTIGENETAGELHDRLMRLGGDLAGRALAALSRGTLDFHPQDGETTYAKKIEKAEARIDWNRPAREVHNHIRGLSPFPGAWFEAELSGKAERIKALRSELDDGSGEPGTVLDANLTIACADGAVRLTQLQRAGKGAMAASDFLRGTQIPAGAKLA